PRTERKTPEPPPAEAPSPPAAKEEAAPLSEAREKEYKNIETQLHSIFGEEETSDGSVPDKAEPPSDAVPPSPAPLDPVTASPGTGKADYQQVESALAGIFDEEGEPGPPADPPPHPSPPDAEEGKIGLVGIKTSPDTKTVRGLKAGDRAPRPPAEEGAPAPPAELPDFVSRVIMEIDHRMTEDGELADTAEMEPEAPASPPPGGPKTSKKAGKPGPRKDLDALKDLFADDD
ncbi:MAG: hypothetical protein ACYS47_19330, partial [Planctomycetota bacterium]